MNTQRFVLLALVFCGVSLLSATRTNAQTFRPCPGGSTSYSGSLSFTGDFDYQPNGSYYYSASTGYHKGCLLFDTESVDFDLYLLKWNGTAWVIVASSESADSIEKITFFGMPGYYRWEIYSYSGADDYLFYLIKP